MTTASWMLVGIRSAERLHAREPERVRVAGRASIVFRAEGEL